MRNLSQLIKKEREVKAIIYKDEENNILKAYKGFEYINEKYRDVTEIYMPSREQAKEILELLVNNVNANVQNKKLEVEIDGEFTLKLIKDLTNINIDLDEKKDKEKIQEILNNPSPELLTIKDEIDKIVNFYFLRLYSAFKEYSKNPQELKDAIDMIANQEIMDEEERKIIQLEEELANMKKAKKKKTNKSGK